jgi:hypothetical protein
MIPYSKVFGIGLSKTGTTSLNSALNMLDIKSIHCPLDDVTYSELISANYNLSLMKQYTAITDIVASPFYREFDKLFPNSLFILTIRNKDDWLNSMKTHIEQNLLNGLWLDYINSKEKPISYNVNKFAKMCSFLHAVNYGCLTFSKDKLLNAYDAHFENVLNYFDGTKKLLVIDICSGEGWEKLCPFLQKDKLEINFPHENKRIKKSINLVHLLCVPQDQREKDSVICLEPLQNKLNYIKHVNPPYTEKPPADSCYRPNAVTHKRGKRGQLWSGHYGAFLAHKKAVFEEFSSDYLLICECDCQLTISCAEFLQELDQACSFMEKEDIAYMSFGNEELETVYSKSEYTIVPQIFKTHCIMFPKKSKQILVNAFLHLPWDNIDFFYNRVFAGKKIAISNKVLARQKGNSLIDTPIKII